MFSVAQLGVSQWYLPVQISYLRRHTRFPTSRDTQASFAFMSQKSVAKIENTSNFIGHDRTCSQNKMFLFFERRPGRLKMLVNPDDTTTLSNLVNVTTPQSHKQSEHSIKNIGLLILNLVAQILKATFTNMRVHAHFLSKFQVVPSETRRKHSTIYIWLFSARESSNSIVQ